MATAEKLSYLNETKKKIKESIAKGGLVSISDTTPFRQYADLIEEQFNAVEQLIPEVTATGDGHISYDNALDYKTKVLIGGNVYQNGIPTPDNPVEVEALKEYNIFNANQAYIATASNLFTIYNPNKVRLIYKGTSGQTSPIFSFFVLDNLKKYVGRTIKCKCDWTVSANNTGAYYIGICSPDANNRIQKAVTAVSGAELSFVVPELQAGQENLLLALYSNYSKGTANTNDYVDFDNITITVDGENFDFVPNGLIGLKRIGKNLAYKNIKGYFSTTSTSFRVDGDSESFLFYAKEGETYTRSCLKTLNSNRICKVETTNVINGTTVSNVKSITGNSIVSEFTGWCIWYVNNAKDDEIQNTFQIENNNVATEYEPYKEDIYTIDLKGNELLTDDDLIIENGHAKIIKKMPKYIFNGSESWSLHNNNSNRACFKVAINGIERYSNANNKPNIISNYFTPVSENATWLSGTISRTTSGGNYIFVNVTSNTTLQQFKDWLSAHNTTVYYQLAEPIEIDLGEVEQTKSFEGTNNVTLLANLSGELEETYKINANKLINQIETNMLELGGE